MRFIRKITVGVGVATYDRASVVRHKSTGLVILTAVFTVPTKRAIPSVLLKVSATAPSWGWLRRLIVGRGRDARMGISSTKRVAIDTLAILLRHRL